MRFGAVFWTHRTTWPRLRDAVLAAERAGFESLWIDDHILPVQGDWRDPKFDGWTLLASIATLTERCTVGPLVSSATFRNPGILAKMAVTLDHVSSGRAVLGMGAGYYQREHDAFGIEFGSSPGERADRLDEAVMLVRRLLDGEAVNHHGRFYDFRDAVAAPGPVQRRLPIMVGGVGRQKALRTTARYADMWNGYGTFEEIVELNQVLTSHCRAIGRDPASIERSFNRHVAIRDDAGRAQADWRAISDRHAPSLINPEQLEIGGPPSVVAAELRRYQDVGLDHVMWVFRDPYDMETLERMTEVRGGLSP